jgi:activating signal cointegrator 1
MKCLSIWDPWATLIAIEAKEYETRSWRPPEALIGQRIAIHAAKSQEGMKLLASDREFAALVWQWFKTLGVDDPNPFRPGCIIATAVLLSVTETDSDIGRAVSRTEKALGDWRTGRFAWRLARIRTDFALPCRGKQGLFDVPAELLPVLEAA